MAEASDNSPDYKALWRQAEQDRERADQQRERADQERKRAEEELDKARRDTQLTTFAEFIRGCHIRLSRPIRVQTNPDLSTQGSLTSPEGRSCPTHLRFWTDFHTLQHDVYTKVFRLLEPAQGPSPRLFSPLLALENLGRQLHLHLLASEADLQTYARFAVEDQVHQILDALKSIPGSSDYFPLDGNFWFDNHSNTLSERLEARSSRRGGKPTRSNTDQFCVHRTVDGRNDLLTIVEYKPPHKLSPEQLRAGLRDMNVWEDVVQQTTMPTDREEKLQYVAKLRVAIMGTQVHDSMIKDGVAYACMTTGLGQVFFHVPESDPETLLYFLAEPNLDVESMGQADWRREPVTAVGRMLALCLMSLTAPVRSQAWRNGAVGNVHTWTADVQQPAARGPALRSRTRSEAPQEPAPVFSPTPGAAASSRTKRSAQSAPQKQQDEMEPIDYCTQSCLLGLRDRGELDLGCPNYERHRCSKPTHRHLIDRSDLASLLKVQLDASLDHYITPCGDLDSGGAPLRVSLMPYGYTFIGKGTPDELRDQTRREAEAYQVLHSCQGSAVPVCLGTIDLLQTYFVHPGICVTNMLLLSWAGEPARPSQSGVLESTKRAKRAIARCGIRHHAFSQPANMLWNSGLGRVQLINFHSATWSPRNLLPLSHQSSRKRSARVEEPGPKRLRIR
ncbi:hypothetical protein NUU61_001406 [Penicillium alfredii]|uniref:Uncharacterized protein n=1 Tax=Penicillium alfredii TaxID=1506179 RepID=A0A9W9G426_9EURO|nr:uncharacterized protein NUU61_001406 [Penicillium alfredii]KAJ5111776.1 hypothetical protein NUU61_001406 [Penicillium alfredii]